MSSNLLCKSEPDGVRRRGTINTTALMFLASVAVLVLLVGLLAWGSKRVSPVTQSSQGSASNEPAQPLVVLCAAGLKTPVEQIAKDYEKEFGVPVQLQFGGTQTLMANVEISRVGDLFIPADDSYVAVAREKKLIDETLPIGSMRPVLVVRKGNPLEIKSLDDLLAKEVRVAQANPDAAAVGKITREALRMLGKWEALEKKTIVFKPTVNDVGNDLKVGAVDAGILWDALLKQFPDLEIVPTDEFANVSANLVAAVLSSTRRPAATLHFARYLTARDKGLLQFEKSGFKIAAGDPWLAAPEITLYAGSMLRPPLEATIAAFEKREGVRVNCVYNGCGILVSQMKAGKIPDAYFACDKEFMQQVKDLFPDPHEVSRNQLVILVPKGNPQKIRSLRDLGKESLRVGIGHEKQCAMGWLTQKTFDEAGLREVVMKNVQVQSPTGDMLVNQLRVGSLDAAVAYLSNATNSGEFLDAIRIDGLPCSIAVQPFGVAKGSEQKQLAHRFYEAIQSAASQERFLDNGFDWTLGKSK